jgi:hypothetical protein
LKKVVTYLLLFTVSFAYNIETVKYLLKAIGDSSITCMDDFQCEENDSEEKEESNKEKKNLSDDYFFDNHYFPFLVAENIKSNYKQNKNLTSSDFQKEVYSPPEL